MQYIIYFEFFIFKIRISLICSFDLFMLISKLNFKLAFQGVNRLTAEIKFPVVSRCRSVLVITYGDSTVLTSIAELRCRG